MNAKRVFPQKLKALLESRQMTQAALAKALGIQRASVSDWVHGRSLPSPDNLSLLSSLTGESEASLLGHHSAPESPAQRNAARLEARLGSARLDLLSEVPREAIDALLAQTLLEGVEKSGGE